MRIFFLLCMILFTSSREIAPKICINCRYFIQPANGMGNEYGRCSLFPISKKNHLVDGVFRDLEYYRCSTARGSSNLCGEDAKKYKKKYTRKTNKDTLDGDYDDDDRDEDNEEYDCYHDIIDKKKRKYIQTPFDC